MDDDNNCNGRRHQLKQRLAQLQDLVDQLLPNDQISAGFAEEPEDPLDTAIDELLPGLLDAARSAESGPSFGTHTEQCGHDRTTFESWRTGTRSALPLGGLFDSSSSAHSNCFDDTRRRGSKNSASPAEADRSSQVRRTEAFEVLRELLPAANEMKFNPHSLCWLWYREVVTSTWLKSGYTSLHDLTTVALESRDPCMLGLVLLSMAVSTGDTLRFAPLIEKYIINDDELAESEYGLSCLLSISLCYVNALKPRQAWIILRRASTLLQLNGLHLNHRKSSTMDSIFWQLLHMDRWVSLMIGLPYALSDHLCNLSSDTSKAASPEGWMYRQLAVVTGRAIDCLQDPKGANLSSAIQIDEQINEIMGQLPAQYLALNRIQTSTSRAEKNLKVCRFIQVCQLKIYAHLPFMLRSNQVKRYQYSHQICVAEARQLIAAYLELFNTEPSAISHCGPLSFGAFMAATVLLLGVFSCGQSQPDEPSVWPLIYSTVNALMRSQRGATGRLCQQCYVALERLTILGNNEGPKTVVLPYFGTLALDVANNPKRLPGGQLVTEHIRLPNDPEHAFSGTGPSLSYYGPFASDGMRNDWVPAEWWPSSATASDGDGWPGDVTWLNDVRPNVRL